MVTHREQQLQSRPDLRCRVGIHEWETGSEVPAEVRRCVRCLKVQVRGDGTKGRLDGKWHTRQQHNCAWCSDCGNEMVGCPRTGCVPIEGGAYRVRYTCGRCGWHSVFDYGLAPVAIKVESHEL